MKKKEALNQNKEVFKTWVKNPSHHHSAEKMEKGHIPVVIPYLESFKFNAPTNILDIGCGTGFVLEWFAKRFANTKITGIDLTPEMVELSKKRTSAFSNVTVLEEEFCTFANNRIESNKPPFDFIFSNEAWYYIPEADLATELLTKILSPHGNASILIDYFKEHEESAKWEEQCGIKAHFLSKNDWTLKFKQQFQHMTTFTVNQDKTFVLELSRK